MSKEKASQRINSRGQRTTRARKISPAFIAIPAIVVVAGIGILLWSIFGRESNSNLVVTPDNVQDVIAALNDTERTPMGSYEVAMNTDWVFPNSSAASDNAYVANNVANTNTVYFTIALDGSDEDIYTSPYIPVGSSLENITLNQDMEAGTYDAILTYHLIDDDNEDISTVSVRITITIEN